MVQNNLFCIKNLIKERTNEIGKEFSNFIGNNFSVCNVAYSRMWRGTVAVAIAIGNTA